MSIIKHIDQRVAVLIDAQNIYHTAKHLYDRNVRFEAIMDDAIAGRQLIRAIAYVISSEAGDEKTFFDALTKVGIETKTKDLQIFADGSMKADWDVGIAIDAVKLSEKVDAIILITGDGDFIPAVRYVQEHAAVQVEVVAFGKSTSEKLIAAADGFMDLSEDAKRYLMGSPSRRRNSKTTNSNKRKKNNRNTQRSSTDTKKESKKTSSPKVSSRRRKKSSS